MHEVLVNRLGGLSLPRKSVVRLTDRLDMTLDVYRGREITIQLKLWTFGWLFWVKRSFETVFQSISGRLPNRGRKRRERIE